MTLCKANGLKDNFADSNRKVFRFEYIPKKEADSSASFHIKN